LLVGDGDEGVGNAVGDALGLLGVVGHGRTLIRAVPAMCQTSTRLSRSVVVMLNSLRWMTCEAKVCVPM